MACGVQLVNKLQENMELVHMEVKLSKSRSICP